MSWIATRHLSLLQYTRTPEPHTTRPMSCTAASEEAVHYRVQQWYTLLACTGWLHGARVLPQRTMCQVAVNLHQPLLCQRRRCLPAIWRQSSWGRQKGTWNTSRSLWARLQGTYSYPTGQVKNIGQRVVRSVLCDRSSPEWIWAEARLGNDLYNRVLI